MLIDVIGPFLRRISGTRIAQPSLREAPMTKIHRSPDHVVPRQVRSRPRDARLQRWGPATQRACEAGARIEAITHKHPEIEKIDITFDRLGAAIRRSYANGTPPRHPVTCQVMWG
jgi:hypothetical protein